MTIFHVSPPFPPIFRHFSAMRKIHSASVLITLLEYNIRRRTRLALVGLNQIAGYIFFSVLFSSYLYACYLD